MIARKLVAFSFILILSLTFFSCKKNTSIGQMDSNSMDSIVVQGPLLIRHKATLPYFLRESSGLCFTDGQLWSFGDNGNPNWIFKIDTATGAILQTVTVANYSNTDWEDITADSGYIYVGDFGNNNGDRTNLKILKIKKSDITGSPSEITVNAEAINFSYADQTDFSSNSNTNFDCESIVAIGDSLYLFSKDHGDLQTRCYSLPKIPGTYSVVPLATFNSNGKITAATFDSVNHELALLGYMNQKLNSFVWFFDGFSGTHFFDATTRRINIGQSNIEWQTEGLEFIFPGWLLMSCETTPGNPATIYSVQKFF
jgi:hypothetical protein